MVTRREKIIDAALDIIKSKQNGITLSELCQMVSEIFPDFSKHFIRDNIILLDRFKPQKVYKSERGLFRYIPDRK